MGIYGQIFGASRTAGEYAKKNLYYCDRAGYIIDNPDFFLERDFIDDYLILYVISGYFHLECGNEKSVVSPGYTAIVNLKEKHIYFSDKNDACEILWIDFNCTDDKMSLLTNLKRLPVIFESRENFGIMNEFVYQYVNNSMFGEIQQSEFIYKLLLSAVAWIENSSGRGSVKISEVENYINDHINCKISLSELAGVMHLSKFHFLHVFKRVYGISPIQHVILKKINRASYLLTYSNFTVSEIAEQLGFCSQSHFSAMYKKYTGSFPSEYRKKQ